MKWCECVKVAFCNIIAFRRSSTKIIVGLTVVLILLFCLNAYKITFNQQMIKLESQYKTDCYLEKYFECDSWSTYEEEMNILKQAKDEIGCSESCVLGNLSIKSHNGTGGMKNQISSAYLRINGILYKGRSEILAGINPKDEFWSTDCISIGIWENEFQTFPKCVIEAYDKQKDFFLIGNLPQNERELIISDYMLTQFGIEHNQQQNLIGSRISLYFANKEKVICENYILAGIFRAAILERREKNSILVNLQHMYVNLDADSKKTFDISEVVIRYYINNYAHLLEASERAKKVDEDIYLSLYGGIYEVLSKQIATMNDILSYIVIGFVIATTIYLICVLYFFYEQGLRFKLMLKAIGLNDIDMCRIIFGELLIFCVISLIIGGYFGILLLNGLKNIYDNAMTMEFQLDNNIIIRAVMEAFFYCFFICFLFGMFICSKLKNKSIIEGLNSKNDS